MKRRLDCAFCGRALPAGCRIDKRYCDQRCVELAYYDRHPEKRAQKLAKLRGPRNAAALRTHQPEVGPALVERVEAAQASTRQELGAVRERLAQMEALLRSPGRATQDARPVPNAAQDGAAVRKVAELQAELQAERNRTEQLEQKQAKLEGEIEELEQQLRDRPVADAGSARELSKARDAAAKAEQRIRELEAALKQAQPGTVRLVTAASDSTVALQTARKQIAELETKLQTAAQRANVAAKRQEDADRELSELKQAIASAKTQAEAQAQRLSETQKALREAEQRATKLGSQDKPHSSARLPWTIPSPDDPHRFIPRWQVENGDAFPDLGEKTDQAMEAVPEQLWKGGNRKLSQEMREWLDSPPPMLRRLSQQMVLRIICTPPAERRSDKQREVLGEAVLADSIADMRNRHPELAARLAQEVSTHQENYEFFAVELVLACVGRNLKKYS